jgi:hypothetical protein
LAFLNEVDNGVVSVNHVVSVVGKEVHEMNSSFLVEGLLGLNISKESCSSEHGGGGTDGSPDVLSVTTSL